MSNHPTELTLKFLGQFQVTQMGGPVTAFANDKARGLLAYLAVESTRTHSRGVLAALFWPDYTEESARTNLRQALHQLRAAIGDASRGDSGADSALLLITRTTLQWNPTAAVFVDVSQFLAHLAQAAAHPHPTLAQCPVCQAELRQAVDLYRGDFLLGFAINDSAPFEEWRRITQEQLHLRALEALDQLIAAYETLGDDDQVRRYVARLLELEPWHEAAHRHLMRALARAGQRAAALAQYETCRQRLASELGVLPDEETTALYEQIRVGQLGRIPTLAFAQSSNLAGPQSSNSPPLHTLSATFSSLIGREPEVAEIVTRFQQPTVRLITIVGPGGMGKTRLAIAVATRLALQFTAGVALVELAELSDAALLPQAVAGALGQNTQAELTREDVVATYLHDKQLLLVLDNCEHLSAAAAEWSERWLNACPQLRILATSHGALAVPGEAVWPLSTLPYPAPTVEATPERLLTFAAVQLFVARAQEVNPTFVLTTANGKAVAEICQRLDGIPLALELAAAGIKLFTPTEIAARLSQRIDAAIARNRRAPARQQTMRAALNWTFELLDADEQTLFLRMALFAGGFTVGAVETLFERPDALDVLARLLDRSLVTAETLGEQTRYRIRALIREYAYDQLTQRDEAAQVRQHFVDYFLRLAEHAHLDPLADGEALWLQPDADNLGQAIDWALASEQPQTAIRLAGALTWYWWMRGYLRARRVPLQQVLAHLDQRASAADASPPLTADEEALLALAAGALLALWEEPKRAQTAFAQALMHAEAAQNWPVAGLALRRLAGVAIQQKDYNSANAFIARGLTLWQQLGGIWHIAWLYAHQGDIADEQDDPAQAWAAYEASANLPVDPGARAYPFRRMAYLALRRGDYTQALAFCRESLQLNLVSGDRQGIAACLVGVASIAVAHAQSLPKASRPPVMGRAVQLLGTVESLLQTVEGRLLPVDEVAYQQTIARLRQPPAALSPEAYVAALTAGRTLTLEQAIAVAWQAEELAAAEEPPPPARKTGVPSDQQSGSDHADTLAEVAPGAELHSSDPASPSFAPPPFPLAHLPAPLTPLVGRQAEIDELLARLQEPEVRLLTLIGAGGMGKTRLALAVGQASAKFGMRNGALSAPSTPNSELRTPHYQDGVFFISLAPLTTPDALAPTLAMALGVTVAGDPQQAVLHFLRPKRMLLILDNFEHLLPGASLVAELLQQAPGVQILVTSRERLNLRGEHLYGVPPLEYAHNGTLEEAQTSNSVRLFVQSAQQVQPGFTVNATNASAIVRICQLVEGMPLGLELAAASVGVLSLNEIADELAQSAEILSAEWADLPARQRSMRAVFAWSWQLLNEAERRTLRQIAVFRGGCTRHAAQTVAGATLPILVRLIDKSLVQWQEGADGSGRYTLHELLRQFAAEELDTAGERAEVEERHGRYYLEYLAARGLCLGRGEPKEASAEIAAELGNVRQAWQWAASGGRLVELEGATYAWWQFCQFQGWEAEGRHSFAVAVAGVRQQLAGLAGGAAETVLGQRLLAKLLALHANYLFAQGRDEEMAAQAHEALTLGASSGGVEGETFGTFVLGRALQDLEQKREAGDLWQQTIQLVRRYQPEYPESELLHEAHWMAHNWLRGTALYFGDYQGSRAHMAQALQLCQALGKRWGELYCLGSLAWTDFYLYNFAEAEAGFAAALALARTLGYRRVEMVAQNGLAGVLRLRGNYSIARTLLEGSVTLAAELVFPYDEALVLATLIRLHCQLGDRAAAEQRLEQLTQLLARTKLAKECQLYGYLAAAFKAHYAGEDQAALRYAEQADRVNQQGGDILFRLVDTALILGHTRAAMGQWQPAVLAFQQALDAFQQLGKPALAAEPQAGLAQIALAQGDLAGAQAQVEAILPLLAEQPHVGYNNPFFIYLTCYRVLANGDPRAVTLLQQGYDLLQQDAAALDDESRQRFLTNVPIHRDLVAAYQEMQALSDKVTSKGVTSDKVTESPNHPITQSPPHLVTLSPLYDWGDMPAVDFFTGREAEVAQLTTWLTAPAQAGSIPAQLVLILGMGGIGKTTLAAAVVKAVAPTFAVVIWRSLLNAPPLSEVLRNWLQILSRQSLTAPPESLDEQLRLLLTYLRQERCLLVLDNVESIFVADAPTGQRPGGAGAMRPGYEGYDQLLQRLGNSEHQSCLLLTSRERPYALGPLPAGRGRQAERGRIRVLPLSGLDQQAAHELLRSNGLHTSEQAAAQLIDNYSGNPLALQIVAATIADFFGGDIAAFQQEEGAIFDGMRVVLNQQFARLAPLEREILIWLAIEREAISVQTLRANLLQPRPEAGALWVRPGELLEALQALQNRSLLEKRDAGLTLQNVIIEYTTEYLVEQVCQEILDFGAQRAPRILDSEVNVPQVEIQNLFLNRFALLKAQAKEYVRQSQVRLIVQPLAERLMARLDRAQVVASIPRLLHALRAARVQSGYAAGNLLNLLIRLGENLAGYDFSQLAVWQADLRGLKFAAVNFTGADLTHTAFTADIANAKVLFQPSGELLVAGINSGDLSIWRMVNGQLTDALRRTSNCLTPLIFNADGQYIATAGVDYRIRIWSTVTGECVQTLPGHSSMIYALAFSAAGDFLASSTAERQVYLWDLRSGGVAQRLDGHAQGVEALAFSPDGRILAAGSMDGLIHLWDITTAADDGHLITTLTGHRHVIGALAFSPDGVWLASGSHDGAVRLWDLKRGGAHVQMLQGHTSLIRVLLFQPPSETAPAASGMPTPTCLLASASADQTVRLWSLDGQLRYTLLGHSHEISSLTFSADGQQLASSGADQRVYLWDVRTGQALNSVQAYRFGSNSVCFSPDGALVASGDADQIVRLWQVAPDPTAAREAQAHPTPIGQLRHVLLGHTRFLRATAFSPSGRILASGGADCTIRLWDRVTGQSLFTLTGHTEPVLALAFAPVQAVNADDIVLASSSVDRTIRLWSIAEQQRTTPRYLRQFNGHENEVLTVAFDPTGQTLVSGGMDGSVRIWDVASGATRQRLTGHTTAVSSVAISPDGGTLATSSFDHTLRLWELASGHSLCVQKEGHVGPHIVAFSPDGKTLAYGGDDFGIYLWRWQTDEAPYVLRGHIGLVRLLAFSPTAPLLVSYSTDYTLRLWDLETNSCRQVLRAPGPYAGMNITGVTGISEAQQAALKALGAVDETIPL
jgi:predicted ATPase/WD40 repeat protein/DNA-binding SARP family transcriptional activator